MFEKLWNNKSYIFVALVIFICTTNFCNLAKAYNSHNNTSVVEDSKKAGIAQNYKSQNEDNKDADNSINNLLSILKDDQKRNALINKLEKVEEQHSNTSNVSNNTDNIFESNYIAKNTKEYIVQIAEFIKDKLSYFGNIDSLFLNSYYKLKSYSSDLLQFVVNIPNKAKILISNESNIKEALVIFYSIITGIIFIIVSYIIESNINIFFISKKQRGNKFIDKLIYVGIVLLSSFIPVIASSIITFILSIVFYSCLSVFFNTSLLYLVVVLKLAIIWVLFRTLLIFVKKLLLISFVLNFWKYFNITYKDVRTLYLWVRSIFILLFLFILSFIIFPVTSDISYNLHLLIVKLFFIIFVFLIFIFLYKFKPKIQKALLAFASTTKYFYIRNLFQFLSKRFYILALIYAVVALSSLIANNYDTLFSFLNSTVITILLIVVHHVLQYYSAKYIKDFFSHNFIDFISNIYSNDNEKKRLYINLLGNPKLEILIESVVYYAILFIFGLFILYVWGINVFRIGEYISQVVVVKLLIKIIISFIIILALTLIILLFFRYRILYLSKYKKFDDINKLLAILLLFKNVYIILCSILMIFISLTIFGVPVVTLLASTGFITVFVAFGTKDIMRNFFNALLTILENNFVIGDTITLGSSKGVVENITSSTVRIRDADGRLHIIPFSEISRIVNETKDFSYAYINISISNDSSIKKIEDILRKVEESIMKDIIFSSYILNRINVTYNYNINTASIEVVGKIKTFPGKQGAVKIEFSKRLNELVLKNSKKITSNVNEITMYILK